MLSNLNFVELLKSVVRERQTLLPIFHQTQNPNEIFDLALYLKLKSEKSWSQFILYFILSSA